MMLWLSEVLLQEHEIDSFAALTAAVGARAAAGEMTERLLHGSNRTEHVAFCVGK